MTNIILFTFFIVCVRESLAVTEEQEYKVCFKGPQKDGNLCMIAEVLVDTFTIYYRMDELSKQLVDMETLEDYNTGYGASRVASQEACLIRQLEKTFEARLSYLKSHDQTTLVEPEMDYEMKAVPVENPKEEIGDYLTAFCGELPMFKMIKG
ncbi:hypothetical protein SK128_023212 [Halocaridina rubra]|uniref:BRICHOS domain-containing protein n=1 Tax=Halocaridina rubra TaxID=373956 RepID=A0AAN8WNB6_HALRR